MTENGHTEGGHSKSSRKTKEKDKEKETHLEQVSSEEAPPSLDGAAHGDLAERVGQRLGYVTSTTLRAIFRAVGRVREEAEDVWAEAQSLRRREKS